MDLGFDISSQPNSPQRQALVKLDVGGAVFKISPNTLQRFPDSLLSKMLHEFPSMVENGEHLYVDRHPKAFPWIHEIYRQPQLQSIFLHSACRDGDYKNCVPDLSKEQLQKELDFYQLPSLSELLVEDVVDLHPTHRDTYAEKLMTMILREIEVSGLRDFFPWTVLIYHQIVDGKLDAEQRIYVSPPLPIADMEYIVQRGHQPFDSALQMEGDLCPRQALGERSKLSPYNQNMSFLIWKKGYAFIGLLDSQADKYGMELEEAKAATFYLSNGKMVYGHFILDHKA